MGEAVYLIDTDANLKVALDHVAFGAQTEDRSNGRTAADADLWTIMDPTPGAENQ